MIAVQVFPDRFSVAEQNLIAKDRALSGLSRTNHIRRMTRGIVLKDDTFATLRLVAGDGIGQPLIDAGSNRKDGKNKFMEIEGKRATDVYSNFLLQQVQEERMEKQQIVETFGDPYIFLYGERARIISFSGILANTFDFNWEAEWWYNYENYLRGTKCVEADARVFISFDNTLIGGYIISTAATKMAQERNWVQFQFQLFVTSYANFSDVGNPNAYQEGGIGDQYITAYGDDGVSLSLTEAEAAVFRPNLQIDPPRGLLLNADGSIKDDALSAFAQPLIDGLSGLWSSANQIAESIFSTASQLMNGELIRVPVGFAGTMEFDETTKVDLPDVNFGGVIKYSTFSDNLDEYVGSGDHYGSSAVGLLNSSFGDPNSKKALTYNQKLVDAATLKWTKAGLAPPTEQLGPLSSFLVKAGMGLLGVGATKAWTAFAQGQEAGSALESVDNETDTPPPLSSSQTGVPPAQVVPE